MKKENKARKKPRKPKNPLASLVEGTLHPVRIMGRLVRPSGKAPGAPPGTVVHTGPRRVEDVRLHAMRYDPSGLTEEEGMSVLDDFRLPDPDNGVHWLNVDGLHDTDLLRQMGEGVGVHMLAIEDVANVGQRPKLEDYEDHLFIVLHMLRVEESPFRIVDEQVSIVVGRGYLISFQEAPGDVFGPVRDRLRAGTGKIRSRGADYLAYALIDALVDSYFRIMEEVGERMERLEREVVDDPSEDTMHEVHHLKRELLVLRRSVWPLREMLAAFLRVEAPLVASTTGVYLRDIYDHTYQLIDTVEILREIMSGMRDLYLSTVSNRMNEVMKILTVMASIFIPLTFIAGVYGMNFEHMPELAWPWAYPAVLLFMLGVLLGMLGFFRYKDWI